MWAERIVRYRVNEVDESHMQPLRSCSVMKRCITLRVERICTTLCVALRLYGAQPQRNHFGWAAVTAPFLGTSDAQLLSHLGSLAGAFARGLLVNMVEGCSTPLLSRSEEHTISKQIVDSASEPGVARGTKRLCFCVFIPTNNILTHIIYVQIWLYYMSIPTNSTYNTAYKYQLYIYL